MSIYTTYKCDTCNKEWLSNDDSEQAVSLSILINFGNPTGSCKPDSNSIPGVMWCRTCVMSIGISEPHNEEDKKLIPEKPLSFEEKLIILLEELGFNRTR